MSNLTPQKNIKDLLQSDVVKQKFKEMLGAKSAGFISSVLNVINSNNQFSNVEPNSVLFSAATAAALDLPINNNLGFAYIVPYNQKQKDGSYITVAQFQMGYKGFIQLGLRSNQFKTLNASDVREGEIIKIDRLSGEIEFNWLSDDERLNRKVIGYVSYFKLTNGFEKPFYMSAQEVEAHAKEFSQTYKKYSTGLWKDKHKEMAFKTVLKLLLSKYAPLSIEMQRAIMADQSTPKDFEGNEFEYVDNQKITIKDPEIISNEKERQRIKDHIKNAKDLPTLSLVDEAIGDDQELQSLYNQKSEELI